MIKFNKISLDTTGLTEDEAKEAMAGGEAHVVLGTGGTLEGIYKCERMNAALMANVGVSGTATAATPTKSAIKLRFVKNIVHEFDVKAGDTHVSFPEDTEVLSVNATPVDSGTTSVTSVAVNSTNHNQIDLTASDAVTAGKLTVACTLLLGECVAEDDNIAATDTLTVDAGEMHVNALVRVLEPPHLKPNLTSTTVRNGKVHL